MRPSRPQAFSVERMVAQFTPALSDRIDWRICEMPHPRTHPVDWFRNGMYARKQKADVYHIAGESHYLACFLAKKRTILTVLDCIILGKLTGLKQWVLRWGFFAIPTFKAGHITTISQSSLDELRKWTKLAVKNGSVVPVPLTFDSSFEKKQNSHQSKPVFLTIGTKANKNIERCIEAASGTDCKLLMIGHLTEAMHKKLAELEIEYENQFELSDDALRQAYLSAECLLFPSLAEGFGMPILEAQALGMPVITSNCTSMPEVGGDGALYVDPTSVEEIRAAMIKIHQESDLKEHLIKKGFENLNRFTSEAVAGLYEKLYVQMHETK
jgi:glycosyltransferase involved in cell wall biosynthesis